MCPGDEEKISFINDQGTYYNKLMPFGLKNTRTTYQRLVNIMFRPLIWKSMKVYVNDLLVKRMQELDHLQHLTEAFGIRTKIQIKLNPTKCAFGVALSKFLGHVVTKRGTEANLEKIQAIINMWLPRLAKEV